MNHQVKLLRALEEKSVVQLGETDPTPGDFRIVSATNGDLDKACQEGKFRLDLLYVPHKISPYPPSPASGTDQ